MAASSMLLQFGSGLGAGLQLSQMMAIFALPGLLLLLAVEYAIAGPAGYVRRLQRMVLDASRLCYVVSSSTTDTRHLHMNDETKNLFEATERMFGRAAAERFLKQQLRRNAIDSIAMPIIVVAGALLMVSTAVGTVLDWLGWHGLAPLQPQPLGALGEASHTLVVLMIGMWLFLWVRIAWLNEQLKRRFKEVLAALEKLAAGARP